MTTVRIKEIFLEEETAMGDLEKRREEGCCQLCAGNGKKDSGSGGMQAIRSCTGRGGRACEKYLQIPTFRRWGRRLSLDRSEGHGAPN
jgi:hypothetical protein